MKYLVFFFLVFCACSPKGQILTIDQDQYLSEWEKWKQQRLENLTAPKGWLSLVALEWIEEGENKLGLDKNNELVLPKPSFKNIGTITRNGDKFSFKSFPEAYVRQNDERFPDGEMFTDANENFTELSFKSLYFYIIKRGNKYGLRVKNTLAQKRFDFEGIEYFDFDAASIVQAKVKSVKSSEQEILINDIAGTQQIYKVEAVLEFKLKKKKHRLLAFDGGTDDYFVIFNDETNNEMTYGGGRFVYVPKPETGADVTILNFNKAYNPPCAFTSFATCPIPPMENRLKTRVMAGEKYSGDH